ncbi:MAG: hypothetical protein ACP6IY_19310 [Promethearchaeia archaeon]
MSENNTKSIFRVIRPNYIISLRNRLVFDENGNKVPLGQSYILITTSAGNIAVKKLKEFVDGLVFVRKNNKPYFGKECLIQPKQRLEFDSTGKKVATGSKYVWITTTKFSIAIDWADLEQFIKDLIECMKF